MKRVSIIVPTYKRNRYITRAIDSILAQDYPEMEIIVIDDNSDEGKKANYFRDDVKIIFLDSNHSKGAGRARNEGLKVARGTWILFADADDYFTDYLPIFLNTYSDRDDIDIVYLNSSVVDEDGFENALVDPI